MPNMVIEIPEPDWNALTHWISSAAVAVNPDRPDLTKGQAILAMIRATTARTASTEVTGAVLDQLRREQA